MFRRTSQRARLDIRVCERLAATRTSPIRSRGKLWSN